MLGWPDVAGFAHIAERFVLHVASGASIMLLAWWLWDLGERKNVLPRIKSGWMFMLFPSLLAFTIISFREIYDVAVGGYVVKSIFDWISWMIGIGWGAWATQAISWRVWEARIDIRRSNSDRKFRRMNNE